MNSCLECPFRVCAVPLEHEQSAQVNIVYTKQPPKMWETYSSTFTLVSLLSQLQILSKFTDLNSS